MAKKAHVRLFNLDSPAGRQEYEELMTKMANNPSRYVWLRQPKEIMKSFTRGDIDSKETYQELWVLVEYAEEERTVKKETENVFA